MSLDNLLTRRSVAVKDLVAPAPSDAELEMILRAATRVPDHGKLCPWRIVVLHAAEQRALGNVARRAFVAQHPDASEAQQTHEEQRFTRAPLVLAVLSTPVANSKPVWEQELSAGAVCMNILHAAHSLGYGAKWLTEWVAYDAAVTQALLSSFAPEAAHPTDSAPEALPTRIAGFIYIGTATATPDDRERPTLSAVTRVYASNVAPK